jgi:hypothetical protein
MWLRSQLQLIAIASMSLKFEDEYAYTLDNLASALKRSYEYNNCGCSSYYLHFLNQRLSKWMRIIQTILTNVKYIEISL